ncbi:hypothetical protein RRF57_007910 [Xylaria bambusicola]|uniref:Uncharacterized protein n=1 Tax=Xylaria bambusicola TaxID=326684 RepID=A0AAN7ZAP8_9PEZI
MDSKRRVSYADNYRPPHVRGVVNRQGISPGKEVTEEEEEWSDDSDYYEESSDPSRHRVSHSNSQSYEDFDALQKRMVGRVKTQPALEYAPDTHDGGYDRYWSNDTTRASRRQPNMSSNSPGGQTVPYGPSFTTNPFVHYPGQQHNSGPQYYPSRTQYIPPPPQAYPSAYPEIESIRQELEDMKMENREKEMRRISAKRRVEENRKKKKRAETERRRKAREQEEAEKTNELKIQQMKAEYDRKLESLSAAAKQRDQMADLHSILSKILPPQAAGQFGHGCGPGCGHNSQDKQAHDLSMIMRRFDSLAASERQTPPMRWYDAQGAPIRYYNDRHLIDDLRDQVNDLRQDLYKIVSAMHPRQQRPVNQFADEEYYSLHGPLSSQPPYPLDGAPQLGLSRKTRGGGPRARGRPSSPAVFSGVEEPEPPQTVERRRGNNYPKCEEVDDDYLDGKDLPPAAMAGNSIDGNQKTAENSSRKRILRPVPREKLEARENRDAARVNPFNSNRTAVRRTDDEEYGVDTDHSFDASDEMDELVEECKHRPYLYHVKPDAQFGREVFAARDHPQEPYDDPPRFLPSTSPLTANEDFEVRPRRY